MESEQNDLSKQIKLEFNTLDENSNPIKFNLTLKKIIGNNCKNNCKNKCEAFGFDSNHRYFYSNGLEHDFDYYRNIASSSDISIQYDLFERFVSVNLVLNGVPERKALYEEPNSSLHLNSLSVELKAHEQKIALLTKQIKEIEENYPNYSTHLT